MIIRQTQATVSNISIINNFESVFQLISFHFQSNNNCIPEYEYVVSKSTELFETIKKSLEDLSANLNGILNPTTESEETTSPQNEAEQN